MDKLENLIFVQLNKVDAEKRLVFGRAAQEHPDHAKEIMDYATSKPNFEKWSNMAKDATGGASVGNVRAMHGKVAAGKLTELVFNDDEMAIDVCAKIVDDNEWKKVLEGVYTGFSIGGSYAKRWDDGDLVRYTADPSEISLVDRPCIGTATFFSVQKADGVVDKVEFKKAQQEPEDIPDVKGSYEEVLAFSKYLNDNNITMGEALTKIAARADVNPNEGKAKFGNVKFADAKNKKYPIDNEAHIRAAWNYINHPANAKKYSAEDMSTIKDAIIAAWKDKIDKAGPPSADKAEAATDLKKGLSTCQSLADVVQTLDYMLSSVEYEAMQEGDGSDIPARLNDAVTELGQILVDMTTEEVAELTAANKDGQATPNPTIMAMSAEAKDLLKRAGGFKKAGARNSKTDQEKIQAMHDSSVSLGATCAADKMAKVDNSLKDELTKAIMTATEPLKKALDEASQKIAKLEAQPAAPKVSLRAIAKGEEVEAIIKVEDKPNPVLDPMGKVSETASLIKGVHKQGGQSIRL